MGNVKVWTDEQLLNILYTFKMHHKKWPKSTDFYKPFKPSVHTFCNRFGSWKNAIEKAKELYKEI